MSRRKWYVAGGLALGAGMLVTAVAANAATARVNPSRTAADDKAVAVDSGQQGAASHDAGRLDVNTTAGSGRSWAKSTQFMEIRSGQTRDGRVYLKVRPAKKRILGESFETVPVPGPYTEVAVTQNARILHLDGESGTPDAFVLDLRKRDNRVEGFDLTFDRKGRVTQVDWLYVL